jgi:hypothetical protein
MNRTKYKDDLISQASDQWSRGFNISTTFFAEMTRAGIDVEYYKEQYFKPNQNEEQSNG